MEDKKFKTSILTELVLIRLTLQSTIEEVLGQEKAKEIRNSISEKFNNIDFPDFE